MVAQRKQSSDDSDLPLRPPRNRPSRRSGRAAGGDIVDADIAQASGRGHVGNQRHHKDSAATSSSIAARTRGWSRATTAIPS